MSQARRGFRGCLLALAALGALAGPANAAVPPPLPPPAPREAEPAPDADVAPDPGVLANAPKLERHTIRDLLEGPAWPRRALAAMRLERYHCAESGAMLEKLLADEAWQTRCFAIRTLGRRRVKAGEEWFAAEQDPRVVRTALRHRYAVDEQRVTRAVEFLARSSDLRNKMLAAEIGLASACGTLPSIAQEEVKKVILRLERTDAGSLAARLAALTGQRDLYRPYDWQQWLRKQGRTLPLQSALSIPEGPEPLKPARIATIDPARFAELETHMDSLRNRHVDLAIVIDCTASMGGQLAAAQGGVDDMMLFIGDVVSSMRIGLVAYRDRRDEFEAASADFTSDANEARRRLWRLSAEGGGDQPEAVYPALKAAYTELSWDPQHTMVLILVGDAPPHVGYGANCAALAKRAAGLGLTTHAVLAGGKHVEHFNEIAKSGRGTCVDLENSQALVGEITGLTIGDQFGSEVREFFQTYLELCR